MNTSRGRKMLASAALLVGMGAGGYGVAHAATSSSTSNTSSTSSASNSSNSSNASNAPAPPNGTRPATPPNGSFNPNDPNHGAPGETLLTGDKATKATAAAKAAVPGGTIIRVETDANQGATYEAHMKKSDGSEVTVLMDANFKVTSIVPFGPGAGHGAPNGATNGAGAPSSSTATPSA